MPQRSYPAVLERGDGALGLWFPDFPGCAVAALTEQELLERGSEALEAAMEAVAERDEPLPEPTAVAAIELPDGCDFVAFVAIGAMPPDPSERVNIYLPKSLIERVDREAADRGMSRSSFFGMAVSNELFDYARKKVGRGWLVHAARRGRRQGGG